MMEKSNKLIMGEFLRSSETVCVINLGYVYVCVCVCVGEVLGADEREIPYSR